MSVLLYGSAIL